jgi:signal transduction histidine kinase
MAPRELVRRHGDALLAGLLAVVYVAALLRYPDAHLEVTIPLGIGACLALALRRKAPLATFLIVSVLNDAVTHVAKGFDSNTIAFVAVFIFNLYSLGANARRLEAWLGAVGVGLTVVTSARSDGDTSPSGLFFFLMLCGLPWALGVAFRLRGDKEQELRERERRAVIETAQAVTEERSRIARELHDVVSHAIAVTVLQARGAQKMVGHDDESVRRALVAIEETNSAALTDMRQLLALLRDTIGDGARDEPQPTLERLDQLVDHVRESGLPVDVEITGEPLPLPPGLDLSVYRIVQEALTNVLKHAGPDAQARVRLEYGEDEVEVSVTNTGSADVTGNNGGHGLIGIRERVAVAGGRVDAGPVDGGYAVRVRLPYLVGSS